MYNVSIIINNLIKEVKLITKKLNLIMTKVERLDKIYIIFFIKKYILVAQNIKELNIKNSLNPFIPNFNNFFWEGILDDFFFFFKISKISGYNRLGF